MLEKIPVAGPRAWPPRVTAVTRPFWDALRAGQFRTTRCVACRTLTFPPKTFCPHCWSREIEWCELSGRGTLYSATIVHAAPAAFRELAPYRVGIVDLEEGPRIALRLWGDTPFALDSAVEIVALLYDDGPLFAARPLARGE
ncbi:Zn-ribbon domain-containing OB-fold protein [Burkholderia territorii]|uniref:Zn-ribbon domain-containing OB-fold protein n=1 Tax=Burkholderia territorii TaxID=1503055 RepID=UPI000A79BD77|nr:Zn-ribbon domain-containing OB-fold protein [Burkholderia territorii]